MSNYLDTGYVQTGANVVDSQNLARGCSTGEAAFDGNLNSQLCLNDSYVVIEFNPGGTPDIDELWIKTYGACGTLSYGYGQLIFSLFNWHSNQFEVVKTYNDAVPEIYHWMEFSVTQNLVNLIKQDGTLRLKIEGPTHIGTSARVNEVYVRELRGEMMVIGRMSLRVIDGIGPQYEQQLNDAGVHNVEELYMIYPVTFSGFVNLSKARLYEFQKKADIALNTKFSRATFNPLFGATLISIIETPDNTLRQNTGLDQSLIAQLKNGIALLFVALDNSEIENLTLSSFEE